MSAIECSELQLLADEYAEATLNVKSADGSGVPFEFVNQLRVIADNAKQALLDEAIRSYLGAYDGVTE